MLPKWLTVSLSVLYLSFFMTALAQSWQNLPLTDVRTGETFTLADFAGETVYVEPMATWCTNCRQQLSNVTKAQAELGDDVTFVALSVETNLKADALKRYADEQNFNLTFAVMTPEFLRALAAEFGQSVLTPPATPHFIVYPDGSSSDLMTGSSSPEAIAAAVAP